MKMANSNWQSFKNPDAFEVQMDPVGVGNYETKSFLPPNVSSTQQAPTMAEFDFHTSTG